MPKQFIMTYNDYVKEFKDVEIAYTLCLLEDRMKSSMKRPEFHDKAGKPYVIMTIKELCELIFVGKNKAGGILDKLVESGYLIKKRAFNGATKLYLPKLDNEATETTEVSKSNRQSLESKPPKVSKSNSNQSHLNQNNKSKIYTVDTEDRNETRIEKWKQSVTGASKIPVLAVEKILDYTNNDVNKAYAIIGLINKAKYNVAKSNHLNNDPITRYENNANIKSGLPARLVHIFSYVKDARNESAYLMNALKTFFKDAFGLVKDEIVKPVAKSDKPVKQPVQPAWVADDYVEPEIPKPTKEAKAKVREMLKRFSD